LQHDVVGYVESVAEAIYAGTGIGQTVSDFAGWLRRDRLASRKHLIPARKGWEASTASPKD